MLASHPVFLGMQKGREGEQKNHVRNEVHSASLDVRKRGIKDEQGVMLGSLVVPVRETGHIPCDFLPEALPVTPD